MRAKYLNILVFSLYVIAALSLLGVGHARQDLRELGVIEQTLPDKAPVQGDGHQPLTASQQEAQDKLLMWQITTLSFFGAASLLLVFHPQLVKDELQ